MENIKENYNINLDRINKAFKYFDRTDIPIEKKQSQLERFKRLLGEQNKLMNIIGLRAGQHEVLEGFKKGSETIDL